MEIKFLSSTFDLPSSRFPFVLIHCRLVLDLFLTKFELSVLIKIDDKQPFFREDELQFYFLIMLQMSWIL